MPKGRARPRIAILAPYPADFASFTGGIETAAAGLLEGLRSYQDEFEFHVVSTPKSLTDDLWIERDGFAFHFLGVPDRPWARPRFPWRILKTIRELGRIEPALVHCQGSTALAMATALKRYPRVLTLHGILRDEASKRTGWEFWSAKADAQIEKYVLRRFDAFICISDYAGSVVGDARLKFTIPNAVCSLFFHEDRSRVSPSTPYLLFVGALAPLKRPADLLLAHVELRCEFKNLETVFCGEVEDANYAQSMHRTIMERQIDGARFMGRVSRDHLRDLLSGAVLLVLPSAQENTPMVVAEAMASGAAVVATRVGGIPEMIRDGETGLLYESGNVHELTECLRRLLTDSALRERLGRKARGFAKSTYDPVQVARTTVAAYRQLLNGRPDRE